MKTIEFCPAAACADAVIHLEAVIDAMDRLRREADTGRWGQDVSVQRKLEIVSDRLLLEAEAARDRLAHADPVSSAGALAQLLAAIRDHRVNDDAERTRARRLEDRASSFLQRLSGFDDADCARLSGGTIARDAHPSQHPLPVTG
jgi:hypothetical protein